MPRTPFTAYSFLWGVTTGIMGIVLRLWAQDLQGVAGVVEVPSHSTLSKNQGWSSHFWEVWWLGQLELLGKRSGYLVKARPMCLA